MLNEKEKAIIDNIRECLDKLGVYLDDYGHLEQNYYIVGPDILISINEIPYKI